MNKRKTRMLFQILKNPTIYRLIVGYLITFALIALLILILEPTVKTYGNSLWYCFVSCSTIGFGDIVATNFISKLLTVVLYIYTIVIIAVVTAIITQYFLEIAKMQKDESVSMFLNDLENLPKLPKERLTEISEKVKEIRKK